MNAAEEKIVYETGEKESVNDETDWGYIYDDLDQDNWEDYMGGPDDDYYEQ